MYLKAVVTGSLQSVPQRVMFVVGFFFAFLFLLPGHTALAHNSIDTSSPADGTTVQAPLSEWVLTFANDVPLNSASAEIITSDGVRTVLPSPTHGINQKIVRFALPDDLSGAVSGRWRLVGTDGHIVSERVQFTIESTTIPSDESSQTTVGPTSQPVANFSENSPINLAPEPVRWALRVANYAALILLGGLIFVQQQLAQGVLSLDRSLLVAKTSAIALTAIPALQALIFVGDLNDSSIFGALFQIGDAFSSTPGSMTLLRALSGGAFIYLIAQRRMHHFQERFIQLALINSAVYLTALAYAGHSRSSSAPWIGIPVDVIHTAATTVWIGGLVVFVLFVLPAVNATDALQAFVKYGRCAQYAVITIVATGVIQTLRLHTGVSTLFTSTHGRLLLLKILCVAAMLKVGDINRRRLLRELPSSDVVAERRRRLLVRASITEASIGAVVIAVTAVLVTSSLP